MKRLFDGNLYRFDTPQPSYWEATAPAVAIDDAPLSGSGSCDVAIIGGGYTGLSAALHLARDYSLDVRVLDAGHLGWGASGRNGGFCCLGGTGVHRGDLVRLRGLEAAREYYSAQVEAVELVRSLVEDEGMDVQPQGDAEVEVAHTRRAFRGLQRDHALLRDGLQLPAELISAGECRERFFVSTEMHGALIQHPAFGLHPLRYCRGLAAAASRHGARLHSHSEVTAWEEVGGRHRLATAGGSLSAARVVFACNGFMPETLRPEFFARTMPVISAIIVTRPLSAAELAVQAWVTDNPSINSRRVLNYFRLLPDRRFLFGGRGDVVGDAAGEQRTYRVLEQTLRRSWPGWRDVTVDYRWHGLICTTATLCPSIGQLEDANGVYFGFGYHGNGVNTATWTGQQLANWIGRGRRPERLPAIVTGLGRRFPVPAMRRSLLRAALFAARQLDRFG